MNKSAEPSRLLMKIHKEISDRAIAATGLMRASPETMLRCAEESKGRGGWLAVEHLEAGGELTDERYRLTAARDDGTWVFWFSFCRRRPAATSPRS
jgi:hypothetical protein